MKKILLASALTIATATSISASTKHGFYVGAALAGVTAHHSAALNYQEPGLAPQANLYDFAKNTAGVDVMLGYAAMMNSFMLGAELDYLFANLKRINTLVLDNTTSRVVHADSTSGAWGLAVRLGYSCFERVMPYLRLGIENRSFKMIHTSTDTGVASATEISVTTRKTAFAPGVGMDFKFNNNFVIGIEYRTAFYGNITKTGINRNTVPQRTVSYRLSPRVSTGLLTLKYVWGK